MIEATMVVVGVPTFAQPQSIDKTPASFAADIADEILKPYDALWTIAGPSGDSEKDEADRLAAFDETWSNFLSIN